MGLYYIDPIYETYTTKITSALTPINDSESDATPVYASYTVPQYTIQKIPQLFPIYEGWNFNSGNYLFTTDTK